MLFAANLVGIATAALLVFLVAGAPHRQHRSYWFRGGSIALLVFAACVLVPLAFNYERFTGTLHLQRQTYLDAAAILASASNNPRIVSISISGAEATTAVVPLTSDPSELSELTQALQRATDLQVLLVEG